MTPAGLRLACALLAAAQVALATTPCALPVSPASPCEIALGETADVLGESAIDIAYSAGTAVYHYFKLNVRNAQSLRRVV